MSAPRTAAGAVRVDAIARHALACGGAGAGIAATAAVVVVVGGLRDDLRRELQLPLHGWPRRVDFALDIALHNIRFALTVLLCAALSPWLKARVARRAIDAVLVWALVQNTALIGTALAAYGGALAKVLALHLPLELAAMSIAGGTYLASRQAPLRARTLAACALLCTALLVAGGFLETYTPFEGSG